MGTNRARGAAIGAVLAGVVGLGLLVAPGGAGAAPELPPVGAEELVASVLTAEPGPFGGAVQVDSALGLPALPDLPQVADGTSTARVWSDGEGRGRVQLPTDSAEKTIVDDGTTLWHYDSAGGTVSRSAHPDRSRDAAAAADPTALAAGLVERLRATSTVAVDGTAEVAGRPAYELVLAPAPTERTLLREVRIAVDAERRVPLRLTVLGNGATEPALQAGFTDVEFVPQDPALFTFTPPPGATVEQHTAPAGRPGGAGDEPTVVGDGWDTVVVAALPDGGEVAPELGALGTPVSGEWGRGRLVTTAVAGAIVTDDGRVAAGAVPEQVLTEALGR
jgi:outer membrane lipoprotein-sorting protein